MGEVKMWVGESIIKIMQNIQKNFYVITNGHRDGETCNFATKREAILHCIKERELDFKVGAINNWYEVYNYLDIDNKCVYTTQGIIYKFMRGEKKKVEYDYNKRCEVQTCFKYICGKGEGNLCSDHYDIAFGKKVESNVNKIFSKIDIAKAISQTLN